MALMEMVFRVWHAFSLELQAQMFWLRVNFVLAVLPGVFTAVLTRYKGPRGRVWWAGAIVTLALLPNAPYAVTDLGVHLHKQMLWAPSRDAARFGVLPIYVILAVAGVSSFAYTLSVLRRELAQRGWSHRRRLAAEAALDVACSIGVALGRVGRLNSWDLVRPGAMWRGLHAVLAHPRELVTLLVLVVVVGAMLSRIGGATRAVVMAFRSI